MKYVSFSFDKYQERIDSLNQLAMQQFVPNVEILGMTPFLWYVLLNVSLIV